MLKTTIQSGSSNNTAVVTSAGALKTTLSPTLGVEDRITAVPFTQFLSVGGEGIITSLRTVNATLANPIEAFVTGNQLGDFYITSLNILIADSNIVKLNRFGNDAPLPNGLQFFYSIPEGEVILGAASTNFDIIRLGSLTKATGGKADAFQLSNADPSNNDGYNPIIDLSNTSPNGNGVRLRKNTRDKLGIRIRDDLTGVNTFNILAIGFLRLINENGE